MPSLVPSGMVQGQQLIQIQTPTGLSTMLLPTAVNPGAGPANAQQIYFTQVRAASLLTDLLWPALVQLSKVECI